MKYEVNPRLTPDLTLLAMRHRAQLEERLGPLVLAKLFELVADGSIGRGSLEIMSLSRNMDVFAIYRQCERDKESLKRTLERMLEEWYEKKVSSLSPSEAVKEFERILEVTCPTSVCEIVKRGSGEFQEQITFVKRFRCDHKGECNAAAAEEQENDKANNRRSLLATGDTYIWINIFSF